MWPKYSNFSTKLHYLPFHQCAFADMNFEGRKWLVAEDMVNIVKVFQAHCLVVGVLNNIHANILFNRLNVSNLTITVYSVYTQQILFFL